MDHVKTPPQDPFDRVLERRGTGSLKWDGYAKRYGYHDPDLLPMWVADLDFPSPPSVSAALENTARTGLFGYPASVDAYFEALMGWLHRRHGFAPKPDWLLPAPGVIAAVSLIMRAVSEPGDQILVQQDLQPSRPAARVRCTGKRDRPEALPGRPQGL